jgi:hypothetical protein
MKFTPVLVALTLLNAGMLAVSLHRSGEAFAQGDLPVLRGRGLQIVDDHGRVRASIQVLPADPDVKMPDGSVGYPETVLLRLINSQGSPNVKIAATEVGAAQVWGGESNPTYAQMLVTGPNPLLRLNGKDGRTQVFQP